MEVALKINELAYIPTSPYASGEMKHGPIALLGPEMSVIFFHASGQLEEKSLSNLSEVRARKAQIVLFTDTGIKSGPNETIVRLPGSNRFCQAVLFAVAGQLLAYHTAVALGRDVDKPRNLAKSVTVE